MINGVISSRRLSLGRDTSKGHEGKGRQATINYVIDVHLWHQF